MTSRTHERSHCHPPRCAAITNAFQTRNRRVLSSPAFPCPPTSSAFSFLLILSLYLYIYLLRINISNTIYQLFHFPRIGKYRRCYFENSDTFPFSLNIEDVIFGNSDTGWTFSFSLNIENKKIDLDSFIMDILIDFWIFIYKYHDKVENVILIK